MGLEDFKRDFGEQGDGGAAALRKDVAHLPDPAQPSQGWPEWIADKAAVPFRLLNPVANALTDPLVDLSRVVQQGEPFGQVARYPTFALPQPPMANPLITAPLRFGPGFIPNPAVAGAGSAAGEMIAQQVERPGQPADYLQVGLAGATPPAAATAFRLIRGLGRTATRLAPSLFQGAHREALDAAAQAGESLAPNVNTSQLFQAARQAGSEQIPASNIRQTLDRLAQEIPADPVSPELKMVRAYMENMERAIGGQPGFAFPSGAAQVTGPTAAQVAGTAAAKTPQISLNDLMGMRRDIGLAIGRGRSGEVKALYGAVMNDLGAAANAGGPGAGMAKEALTAFKQDLAVNRWNDLVKSATDTRSISGADVQRLNVSRLRNALEKNSDEFTRLVGQDGVDRLRQFTEIYRSLPPETALNFHSRLVGALAGGAGVLSAGPHGAVAALLPELAANMFSVGANPREVGMLLQGLAQAGRAVAGADLPPIQVQGQTPPR